MEDLLIQLIIMDKVTRGEGEALVKRVVMHKVTLALIPLVVTEQTRTLLG